MLLDTKKAKYTARLLELPKTHPTAQLLPITLRHGDIHAQPVEQQPLDSGGWAENSNRVAEGIGQRLNKHLSQRLAKDPERKG